MNITEENIRFIVNSGYLMLSIILLALVIVIYPTLRSRSKKK